MYVCFKGLLARAVLLVLIQSAAVFAASTVSTSESRAAAEGRPFPTGSIRSQSEPVSRSVVDSSDIIVRHRRRHATAAGNSQQQQQLQQQQQQHEAKVSAEVSVDPPFNQHLGSGPALIPLYTPINGLANGTDSAGTVGNTTAPAKASQWKREISLHEANIILQQTSKNEPDLALPLSEHAHRAIRRHRACSAFYLKGHKPATRIAVVGNGPLTDSQRDEIASSDMVVRFNKMNNRQARISTCLWLLCLRVHMHIKSAKAT